MAPSTNHAHVVHFYTKALKDFFAGFYLAFQIINKEIDRASVVADEREKCFCSWVDT